MTDKRDTVMGTVTTNVDASRHLARHVVYRPPCDSNAVGRGLAMTPEKKVIDALWLALNTARGALVSASKQSRIYRRALREIDYIVADRLRQLTNKSTWDYEPLEGGAVESLPPGNA